MLARQGIYFREQDLWIVFFVFKGNDPHSGFHPSFTPEMKQLYDESQKVWESSVDRIAYVSYATEAICSRTASLSVTPPLHFGNMGQPVAHQSKQLNFSQHSRGILGDQHSTKNRLGREYIWTFLNALRQSGMSIDMDLYKLVTYTDSDGSKHSLIPPDYNMDSDAEHIKRWRGYWAWYCMELVEPYYIRFTKYVYQREQEKTTVLSRNLAFPAMERSLVTQPLQSSLPAFEPAATETIKIINIISRTLDQGKITWRVTVDINNIEVEKSFDDASFKKILKSNPTVAEIHRTFLLMYPPKALNDALQAVVAQSQHMEAEQEGTLPLNQSGLMHVQPKKTKKRQQNPTIAELELEHEVENILDHKTDGVSVLLKLLFNKLFLYLQKGMDHWKVQWKGFDVEDATWEPLGNLRYVVQVQA